MTRREQQSRGGSAHAEHGAGQSAMPGGRPAGIGGPTAIALSVGGLGLLALGALAFAPGAPGDVAGDVSLPLVFLTGLLAGGLSCLAVQGGLLATTVARRGGVPGAAPPSAARRAAPIAMFLVAKLVAYTILGALLGLLGARVGLAPATRGWLQVVAGVFMLGVAGQLLDLHPVFRRFGLQPPRWLQRRIGRESKRDGLLAPAALGALTVFIPCGTTQAMMVAAVGTGSPTRGALVLFAFVLGTTPLFFALGYLATRLGAALQGAFTRVAAAVVAILALVSLWSGATLAGLPLPARIGAAPAPAAVATVSTGTPGGAVATVQEAVVLAQPRAYAPNRVRFTVGQPARLRVVTGERVGCTSVFTIPSLGIEEALPRNAEAAFDIPTDRPGQIRFTCGMGMYSGMIEVMR